MSRGLLVVVVAALFASALALVTAQHRARTLFVDVERAQQDARALEVDTNRLKIELSRLAQPAYVEGGARALGLRPVDGARTVFLNLPDATVVSPRLPGPRR